MKGTYRSLKVEMIIVLLLFGIDNISGQVRSSIYKNLPVGKYAVGFKIITLTDSNRVSKPAYDYLGEKNSSDQFRKITVHLWYPSKNNSGRRRVEYGDYCYNSLLTVTNEVISKERKNAVINNWRTAMERFLGKAGDDQWNELVTTPMLAIEDAIGMQEKFPLLIGLMRPFTTGITNEFLASHGYIVAMLKKEEPGDDNWAKNARYEIPDMQFVISYLKREWKVESNNIGTFGFSGAGFVPVLFAMHDSRVKALADLECLMYFDRDSLFQLFSTSDYYDPSNLRVPFLHIFGRESSKGEKSIGEFENKAKFSKRYRLLLNQTGFSHGDLTMQGYVFRSILKSNEVIHESIRKCFELFNIYLLNFFNAELKSDRKASVFLSAKPTLPAFPPVLWDISVLNEVVPAPNSTEFENIIRKKGINEALAIVKATLTGDSSSNLLNGNALNNLGYTFLSERKYEEAIAVFKLNTELHPGDANFFDSLAEGYEVSGDIENRVKASGKIIDLLGKKSMLSEMEKTLKVTAERRLIK